MTDRKPTLANDLVGKLRKSDRLEGVGPLGGFQYKLDLSVPYLFTAIHAGHQVRRELAPFIAISETERLFEEDAATDQIIQGNPSVIWALDSRLEYDLNRPPELALPITPERFWGLKAYSSPPPEEMNRFSMSKYHSFHQFMKACAKTLVSRFGYCVVYDIHSYNISRQIENGFASPPVFNIGTTKLDRDKWKSPIESWTRLLSAIELPGIKTTVAENEVFFGKGSLCQNLTKLDPNALVLPTEISKIYMNEHSGELNPEVIAALNKGLRNAARVHILHF